MAFAQRRWLAVSGVHPPSSPPYGWPGPAWIRATRAIKHTAPRAIATKRFIWGPPSVLRGFSSPRCRRPIPALQPVSPCEGVTNAQRIQEKADLKWGSGGLPGLGQTPQSRLLHLAAGRQGQVGVGDQEDVPRHLVAGQAFPAETLDLVRCGPA